MNGLSTNNNKNRHLLEVAVDVYPLTIENATFYLKPMAEVRRATNTVSCLALILNFEVHRWRGKIEKYEHKKTTLIFPKMSAMR